MSPISKIALALSCVAFAGYGMGCFLSADMVVEFNRYRIGRLRILTGVLQVAGSLGLLAGLVYRPLLIVSAGGLSLMMLLAVITRFRIRDPWYAAIPAFTLFALNAYLVLAAL